MILPRTIEMHLYRWFLLVWFRHSTFLFNEIFNHFKMVKNLFFKTRLFYSDDGCFRFIIYNTRMAIHTTCTYMYSVRCDVYTSPWIWRVINNQTENAQIETVITTISLVAKYMIKSQKSVFSPCYFHLHSKQMFQLCILGLFL